MDQLEQIKQPIKEDLVRFNQIFDKTLQHPNVVLNAIFQHIRERKGKLMRPTLLLLVAREFGTPTDCSYLSAVMLELLHTASLVHDDIVDESDERRGHASTNAAYGNKVAVLVGDYLLSSSLEKAAETENLRIVRHISDLGKQLSTGEIIQLSNTYDNEFSEQAYFDVIHLKTASLFAATAEVGVLSVNGPAEEAQKMREFGNLIGLCFQIRDDIFDYFGNADIGKPTGNDMLEGKLTLPVLYALENYADETFIQLARDIRRGAADSASIKRLMEFTKQHNGIEYAKKRMTEFSNRALNLIANFKSDQIRESLASYVDFVSCRGL